MDERTAETADPRDEIARLEEQIEQLEAKLESCQKFAAASRFAMALGGVLLVGLMFGVIPFDPLVLTGAMDRAILVEAPVSSIKISRDGSKPGCSANHACRWAATSSLLRL